MSKKNKNGPIYIYLQWYNSDGSGAPADYITWSEEPINDDDIVYVRLPPRPSDVIGKSTMEKGKER